MKSPKTSVFGLLSLFGSLALGVPLVANPGGRVAHEIRFAPAAGEGVTKTLHAVTNLESEKLTFAIDGDEDALPAMQTSAAIEQTVTVTDVYGATSGGSPASLTRTFGDLSRSFTMQVDIGSDTSTPTGKGASPLSKASVTFTREGETDSYGAKFTDEEEREPDLLKGLVEDMDLRGLLPATALEVGQSYEIPPLAFADVLDFGGDFSFAMETEGYPGAGGLEPSMMTDYRGFFDDIQEASASGELVEVTEIDGEKIARIALRLQLAGVSDISEAQGLETNKGRPEGATTEFKQFDLHLDCEGTGELLWSLDRGVMSALDFKGELSMGMALEAVRMRMEMPMVMKLNSNHIGDVTVSVRTR